MTTTLTYRALTEQEAVEYARTHTSFFTAEAALTSREIGDGNLNLVFQIKDQNTGKSVILKQALPYARVVGESWPLTIDRNRIENEVLRIEGELCPGLVPEIYHYDPILALTIMEDLSDHVIMRKGLIEKNRYPRFAEHIGSFLARTLFFTSDLAMDPFAKKEQVKQFINPELCKITEDLVYTDPYEDVENNSFNPEIRADVERLWNHDLLKLEVAKLKKDFMTKAEALLHGDIHTGSIFVTRDSTKVIDAEFAFYGPIGYDIGALLGNLILNHNAQEGLAESEQEKEDTRAYLLETFAAIWNEFEKNFRELWNEHVIERTAQYKGFQDAYIADVFADTIGVAGLECIRRTVGLAHVADQESIADPKIRAKSERLSLRIGEELILNRKQYTTIEEVVTMIRKITKEGI